MSALGGILERIKGAEAIENILSRVQEVRTSVMSRVQELRSRLLGGAGILGEIPLLQEAKEAAKEVGEGGIITLIESKFPAVRKVTERPMVKTVLDRIKEVKEKGVLGTIGIGPGAAVKTQEVTQEFTYEEPERPTPAYEPLYMHL